LSSELVSESIIDAGSGPAWQKESPGVTKEKWKINCSQFKRLPSYFGYPLPR